jgi:hypothetical protein
MELKKIKILEKYKLDANRELDYFIYINSHDIIVNNVVLKVDNNSILENLIQKNEKFNKVFSFIDFKEKLHLKKRIYESIISNIYEPYTHYFIISFFETILPYSKIKLDSDWRKTSIKFMNLFLNKFTNIEKIAIDFIHNLEIKLQEKEFVMLDSNYAMFLYLYIKKSHLKQYKDFVNRVYFVNIDGA